MVMETFWKANKWNIKNQEAFLLFACTLFAVIGLCRTATLLKRTQRKVINKSQESSKTQWTGSEPGWITIRSKWSIKNQEAFLLFACTIFAVIGLCRIATLLKRKTQRKVINKNQESSKTQWMGSEPGWITIISVLMGSLRWSRANRWEDTSDKSGFVGLDKCKSSLGWQSHNSLSPVWQRPILMGDKCELPRHSGLILYDDYGRLLDPSFTTLSPKEKINQNQGTQIAGRTKITLRDLLYY